MELRPYQVEAVAQLRAAVKRSRSVLYQLPTGAGKTVVIAEVSRLAAAKRSHTLFLAHRRELIDQSRRTMIEAVPGVDVGVEAAGWARTPWAPLQVGMVQTVVNRDDIATPALVVFDEAHHIRSASWEHVAKRWPHAARIGLTATPQRLDGKGLGEFFGEMVQGPSVAELVRDGYLAPTRTLTIPIEASEDKQTARVAESYCRYAAGRSAIVFARHREHSRAIVAELRARGVSAAHVDGDDPTPRRDRIMQEFRDRAIDVVSNVDLISEGYDAPACETVVLADRTVSIVRYLQRVGRAMRPAPGKTAQVLDTVGIVHLLGLPDEDRVWTLADGEVSERKTAEQKPRVCPECHTAFYGRACPGCQYVSALPPVEEADVELREASRRKRAPGGRRAELNREIAAAMASGDPMQGLLDIAERRGYKQGWAGIMLRSLRGGRA